MAPRDPAILAELTPIEAIDRRRLLTALPALGLIAVGVSCGSDDGDTPTRSSTVTPAGTPAGDFPVTISHAKGETTVPAKPRRVVTVGGLDAALANALGADVVAVPTFMKDYPWFARPLAPDVLVLSHEEVPLEAIAALKPDLILITTAWPIYGESYDRLAGIAPTIPHLKALLQDDPAELTRVIGRVLGETAAERLIADAQASIQSFVDRHPGLNGKQFALIQVSGDVIYLVGLAGSLTGNFMRQLGLNPPAEIVDTIGAANLGAGQGRISYERANLLDTADIVFLSDPGGIDQTFRANPVIAELDVVKAGNLVLLDQVTAAALLMPSPVNIPHILGKLEPALTKVEGERKGS
ncbi:MAG: ABC transporter substrate-binding protein [Dehalococcoidia bacterium]